MARIDNLTNFLTDVADAIRNKKSTVGLIEAANFDSEIQSIAAGGEDFEINDARYLFYNSYRSDIVDALISKMQNVKDMSNSFNNFQDTRYVDYDLSHIIFAENVNFNSAFNQNVYMESIKFNKDQDIIVKDFTSAFNNDFNLKELDLSMFNTESCISTYRMLYYTKALKKLIINRQDVFKNTDAYMLSSSAISGGTGFIYVPDNMVESYKSATNWSQYADQIKPISELPSEEV